MDDYPNRSKQLSLINDENVKEKNDDSPKNTSEEVVERKDLRYDKNKKECTQCN